MEQLELALQTHEGRRLATGIATTCCTYCDSKAETRDHVPAKLLINRPFPKNLRTVPSCLRCNNSWSLDEEYLRVILGLLGRNPKLAAENDQGGYIDRILSAKPFFEDRIIASLKEDDNGSIHIEPEQGRLDRIAEKTACGLYALRYGVGRKIADFRAQILQPIEADVPNRIIAAMHYWPGIKSKRWTVVQKDSFAFLFANGWMTCDPHLWCFINFHDTFFSAISCPAGVGRPKTYRLKAKPW